MKELVSTLSLKNTNHSTIDRNWQCVRCFIDDQSKKDFNSFVLSQKRPMMMAWHMNFVPSAEYGQKSPVWVSVMRDPISRFISAFNFARNDWNKNNYNSRKNYDRLVSHGSKRIYNLTYDQWVNLDLNWCLENNHPDCLLVDNEWGAAGKGHTQIVRFFRSLGSLN